MSTKDTPAEVQAYALADDLAKLIHQRTGIEKKDLQCPREKTFMTPCIARDGRLAVCFGAFKGAICVGCEKSVSGLHKQELDQHGMAGLA